MTEKHGGETMSIEKTLMGEPPEEWPQMTIDMWNGTRQTCNLGETAAEALETSA